MEFILIEIVLLFLLILLAGYFSAAEIAIATFGANKIEELKEHRDKSVSAFETIQKESDSFFGAIQILTIIFSLSAAMLGLHISITAAASFFGGRLTNLSDLEFKLVTVLIALLPVTFLILVFANLIPKVLGFKYAESIGKSSVYLLIFITAIFKYPVRLVTAISNLLLIPFKEKTSFSQSRFSEDEIRIIISEGVKSGAINETEHEIIENIFEFNDLKVKEVMVPRTEMTALELLEDKEQIAKHIIQTSHSLIPVFEDSLDNIIGVLHTKDFMKAFIDANPFMVKSLIRPAYFVPETKLISELLKEMQKRGERLAIVTDEYGGTEGVLTIEDILEEIVGEIADSSRTEVKEYNKLPDGKYYVLGSMPIDDFNETFNFELPNSEDYNTVAGFVAYNTGKILNTGEIYQFENLYFELIKKLRQKMVQFKIYSEDNDFVEKETKT